MSIIQKTCYNIQCDGCGRGLSDAWYAKAGHVEFMFLISECGWITTNNKHYCPDCFEFYEDGRCKTKDGRIFDPFGHEIKKTKGI